jgi:Tol biopolymer transport system component
VGLLNVVSGAKTEIERDPDHNLLSPEISADGRWIAFHQSTANSQTRRLIIDRLRDNAASTRSEWMAVTDGSTYDVEPRWSPDGNTLYFISRRDGHFCIWAQRLESATKRPLGATFPVQHFHTLMRDLTMEPSAIGLAVARDKLVVSLKESTGNIWLTELQGQK